MPPIMHLEKIVIASPMRLARGHPFNAALGTALHFKDMRDRVVRPAIKWLALGCLATDGLGPGILSGLFQTEGIHAQNDGISRLIFGPFRQHPRHPVAQVTRVRTIKIHQVARLQADDIMREIDVVAVKPNRGVGPVVAQQGLQCRDVGHLVFGLRKRASPSPKWPWPRRLPRALSPGQTGRP